jgi:hypothetical protein
MVKCASAFAFIKCKIEGSVKSAVRCDTDDSILRSHTGINRCRFQIYCSAYVT